MAKNRTRGDPYKNFKFRVVLGVAFIWLAGCLTKKALVMSDARGVRRNANWRLFGIDQRSLPPAKWDDLVLPPNQIGQLRSLALDERRRMRVDERSTHGKNRQDRAAVTVLFSGPPGTGKSMAAQVLANELGVDLYHVDLSRVLSKYVGETEKNLQRILGAAEESGAVLLFDEADALFGKRSDVKDSHDRYANIEVSYLLERMEAYDGLVILTTNRKQNIDSAFLRRLRYIVEFPSQKPVKKAARRLAKATGRMARS